MRKQREIKDMYSYILGLQQDAEHKLSEHSLSPLERKSYERVLMDAGRDAQVLEWVLGTEGVLTV